MKINDFRGPGKEFTLGPLGPAARIARRATVRSMIAQKGVKKPAMRHHAPAVKTF
jgi:hypothetical protein